MLCQDFGMSEYLNYSVSFTAAPETPVFQALADMINPIIGPTRVSLRSVNRALVPLYAVGTPRIS